MSCRNFKYRLWILFLLIPFITSAQWESGQVSVFFTLPEVALVDIEPALQNSVHLAILPEAESGNAPSATQTGDNSLWLNYSSALPANQTSRSITAEISHGTIPPGIRLFLEASAPSGNGEGQQGQATGRIELSNQPRPVVTGIGNGYTGDGTQTGHQLTFSIEISDFSKLETNGENNFVIRYTLTDN